MNTDKIYAEKITSEYAPKETSKVRTLKKLDKKAKKGASIFALSFGIASSLLLGVGMCLSMKIIGNGSTMMFILGIIIGIIGIVFMSLNYHFYTIILEKGKKKYGNDILELAKQVIEE